MEELFDEAKKNEAAKQESNAADTQDLQNEPVDAPAAVTKPVPTSKPLQPLQVPRKKQFTYSQIMLKIERIEGEQHRIYEKWGTGEGGTGIHSLKAQITGGRRDNPKVIARKNEKLKEAKAEFVELETKRLKFENLLRHHSSPASRLHRWKRFLSHEN